MKASTGSTASAARRARGDEGGVAFLGVLIFAFIVALTGLAFYAMASYEFKSAKDRQESSEAFYLADGAVERARGELLVDKAWRGPVPETALGSGTYRVTAADTLYNGFPAVLLHGEGRVGDGARGVEVFGAVRGLLEEVGIYVGRDMIANGNLNVYGAIHVNGDGDFGPDDDHLKSGTYDEGYAVRPPAIYTDPEAFPDASFYQVRVKSPSLRLEVYWYDRTSRGFKKLTGNVPFGMTDEKTTPPSYSFNFNGVADVDSLFNYQTGYFHLLPGDSTSVVVDFGHPNDGEDATANIEFHIADPDYAFRTTIINARFEGIDEGDNRTAPCSGFWVGGNVTFGNQMTWEPRNCVALVTNHLGPPKGKAPNAQGRLGTFDVPALTYVTGNVEGIKGQLEIHGILISLCDIYSQGGPDVWHDPSILDCIPAGVLSDDESGYLETLEWREVGVQ